MIWIDQNIKVNIRDKKKTVKSVIVFREWESGVLRAGQKTDLFLTLSYV